MEPATFFQRRYHSIEALFFMALEGGRTHDVHGIMVKGYGRRLVEHLSHRIDRHGCRMFRVLHACTAKHTDIALTASRWLAMGLSGSRAWFERFEKKLSDSNFEFCKASARILGFLFIRFRICIEFFW